MLGRLHSRCRTGAIAVATLSTATVVASVLAAVTLAASPAAAGPPVAANAYQAWLLCQLNEVRADHGAAPLQFDAVLSGSAREWARRMRTVGVEADPDLFDDASAAEPALSGAAENVVTKPSGDLGEVRNQYAGSGTPTFAGGAWDRVGLGVSFDADGAVWVSLRILDGPLLADAHVPTCAGRSKPPGPGPGFTDVPGGSYYDGAVDWLRESGVTTGVAPRRYGPEVRVTRAQMAAFLWRLAGLPATGGRGFDDVPSGAYYAPGTRWLRATGISTGVGGSDRYQPSQSVTRAQMVTFLHRYAGTPTPAGPPRFTDVPPDRYYSAAVSWAAGTGITTGLGGSDRFAPHQPVTRAQMAAFLARFERARQAMAPGAQPLVG